MLKRSCFIKRVMSAAEPGMEAVVVRSLRKAAREIR